MASLSWLQLQLLTQVTLFAFLFRSGQGDITVARTSKGLVRGFTKGQTVRFLGIPYATAQRFQFPNVNTEAWQGVRNVTQPGPQCYQLCPGLEANLYCLSQMSEECLTLNIYRPAYSLGLGQSFPVVVYIHGGDFSTGSGGAAAYDGDYFASRGHVIVVTLNYRLGAFGFLSIFGKYGDATGNFGLRDQQAALAWVLRNIEAFQGDPGRVTIMGDGAGCVSAVSHLASPISQSLFHGAILQSCPLNVPYRNSTEAQSQAEAFAKLLNCKPNDVTCYRTKSANEILRAQLSLRVSVYSSSPLMAFYPWGPSIDNDQVFYHPMDVFKELSRFADKPILMGTVANEGSAFVYKRFHLPLSQESFQSILGQITPRSPAYFAPSSGDMRDALADFIQEYIFVCPTLQAAKQIAIKQSLPSSSSPNSKYVDAPPNRVWLYEFFRPQLNTAAMDNRRQITGNALWASLSTSDVICDSRSCHGSDVRALFNSETLSAFERRKLDPISRLMVRYWSNFARKGSVNGGITSREHLRTLQLQSARLSESTSMISRSRPQRVSFRPNIPDIATPAASRVILKSALASFTYWPNYTVDGKEETSVMLVQSPPLMVTRNQWEPRCKVWQF